MAAKIIHVEIPRQDSIRAWLDETASPRWQFEAVGCLQLLSRVRERAEKDRNLANWPLEEGTDHVSLLLNELILKARDEWQHPCSEEEVCHCRGVSRQTVDRAIVNGAHSGVAVSRLTHASTSCGTCRPIVEKIIRYRLRQDG